eukprot:8217604-Lingulodinium_polyedra.AAC.1
MCFAGQFPLREVQTHGLITPSGRQHILTPVQRRSLRDGHRALAGLSQCIAPRRELRLLSCSTIAGA